MKSVVAALALLAPAAAHSLGGRPVPRDIARAQSTTPSDGLTAKGKGAAEVRSVLNGAMADRHPSTFKACEEFALSELDGIIESLQAMASPTIQVPQLTNHC